MSPAPTRSLGLIDLSVGPFLSAFPFPDGDNWPEYAALSGGAEGRRKQAKDLVAQTVTNQSTDPSYSLQSLLHHSTLDTSLRI